MKKIIVARLCDVFKTGERLFIPTNEEIEFIKFDCIFENTECRFCKYGSYFNGVCSKFNQKHGNANIAYDIIEKEVSNNWLKLHGVQMSRKHVSRETLRGNICINRDI